MSAPTETSRQSALLAHQSAEYELTNLIANNREEAMLKHGQTTIANVREIVVALGSNNSIYLGRMITPEEGAKLDAHDVHWANNTGQGEGSAVVSWFPIAK
jgi:hypothetical protein